MILPHHPDVWCCSCGGIIKKPLFNKCYRGVEEGHQLCGKSFIPIDSNGVRKVKCGQRVYYPCSLWIMSIVFILLTLIAFANFSYQQMQVSMPAFTPFHLYTPLIIATIIFFIYAVIKRDSFCVEWHIHKLCIDIGLTTFVFSFAMNYCSQMMDTRISTSLFTVSIPITYYYAWYYFRFRISLNKVILGFFLTTIPLIGFLSDSDYSPSHFESNTIQKLLPLWVVIAFIGITCYAYSIVGREYLYKIPQIPKGTVLLYFHIWVLLFAIFSIPVIKSSVFTPLPYKIQYHKIANHSIPFIDNEYGMSWNQVWQNQHDAFKCFAGYYNEKSLISEFFCRSSSDARMWTILTGVFYALSHVLATIVLDVLSSSVFIHTKLTSFFMVGMFYWSSTLANQSDIRQANWYYPVSFTLMILFSAIYEALNDETYQKNNLCVIKLKYKLLNHTIVRRYWQKPIKQQSYQGIIDGSFEQDDDQLIN